VEQSNSAKADAGRRYRAYPTPEQAGRLTEWGHSCRAVWNLALAQRDHLYRHRGVTLRANAQCVQLTRARGDLPWLADLPAQSAQQVLRQLDRAYDNGWNPEHPAGPPMFKKRSDRLVVPFPGQAVMVRKLNRTWAEVRLPKVGAVRFRLSVPSAAPSATPPCAATGWVGTCRSGSPSTSSQPNPTACPGAGLTSAWLARPTCPMRPDRG
jgi:putative transposase